MSRLPHTSEQPISSDRTCKVEGIQGIHSSTLFRCETPYAPNMQNTVTRIASFDHRWKREKMLAQPKELADAGFYFLGVHNQTKCFYCGGGLQNWEMTDDPFFEHVKWYPNCEYLLRKKGFGFRDLCCKNVSFVETTTASK